MRSTVRALPALVLLVAGPLLAATPPRKVVGQKRFDVSYRIKENLTGIANVELWITTDGGLSWRLWGRDDDTVPPIRFTADQDGEYGFMIVATDKAGNKEATPTPGTPPEAIAIVDTSVPNVRIETPTGGEVFAPGHNLEVRWAAADANLGPKCVDILMSSDGGMNWRAAAQALPNSGSTVIPLPGAAAERYLMKVVVRDLAGNVGEAALTTPVVLDGQAPRARLLGPKVSPTSRIEVTYEAEDTGGGGLAEIMLWYTTDGGLTWKAFGRDPDGRSPMEFVAEQAGSYGFFIQAADRVGNRTPAPKSGIRPELVTIIDNAAPRVQLLSFNSGGAFRGGDSYEVKWLAQDDNMAERPVSIEYSTDAGQNWMVVARQEPNDGSHAWALPRMDAASVLVRVTVADTLGNTGSAQSAVPFTIDSTSPQSTITFEPVGAVEAPPSYEPVRIEPVRPTVMRVEPTETGPGPSVEAAPPSAALDEQLTQAEKWLDAKDAANLSKVLQIVDTAILEAPRNPRARYLHGRYFLQKGRLAEAEKDLREAVSLDPEEGKHLYYLGNTLTRRAIEKEQTGETAAAAEVAGTAAVYLQKALETGYENAEVHLWLGIAGYKAGKLGRERERLDKAVESFGASIALQPTGQDLAVAYYWRAMALREKGDYEEAVVDFDRAAQLFPPGSQPAEGAKRKADELRARLRRAG